MAGEVSELVVAVAAIVAAYYTEAAVSAAAAAFTSDEAAAVLELTRGQIENAVINGLTRGVQAGAVEAEFLLAASPAESV